MFFKENEPKKVNARLHEDEEMSHPHPYYYNYSMSEKDNWAKTFVMTVGGLMIVAMLGILWTNYQGNQGNFRTAVKEIKVSVEEITTEITKLSAQTTALQRNMETWQVQFREEMRGLRNDYQSEIKELETDLKGLDRESTEGIKDNRKRIYELETDFRSNQ